jgi:chromosome segregation ATPase
MRIDSHAYIQGNQPSEQVSELESAISKLTTQLTSVRKKTELKLSGLQEDVNKLSKDLIRARRERDKAREDSNRLHTNMNGDNAKSSQSGQNDGELVKLKDEIMSVRSMLTLAYAEREQAVGSVRGLEREIDLLRDAQTEWNAREDDLVKKEGHIRASLLAKDAQILAFEKECLESKLVCKQFAAKEEEIRAKLTTAEARVCALEKACSESESLCQKLQATIAEMQAHSNHVHVHEKQSDTGAVSSPHKNDEKLTQTQTQTQESAGKSTQNQDSVDAQEISTTQAHKRMQTCPSGDRGSSIVHADSEGSEDVVGHTRGQVLESDSETSIQFLRSRVTELEAQESKLKSKISHLENREKGAKAARELAEANLKKSARQLQRMQELIDERDTSPTEDSVKSVDVVKFTSNLQRMQKLIDDEIVRRKACEERLRQVQSVLDDEMSKRRGAETMIEALQVCLCVYMHACMYIYIYIYIYTN